MRPVLARAHLRLVTGAGSSESSRLHVDGSLVSRFARDERVEAPAEGAAGNVGLAWGTDPRAHDRGA